MMNNSCSAVNESSTFEPEARPESVLDQIAFLAKFAQDIASKLHSHANAFSGPVPVCGNNEGKPISEGIYSELTESLKSLREAIFDIAHATDRNCEIASFIARPVKGL